METMLEIPKSVTDQVCDALEAALAKHSTATDPEFIKLNEAWVALTEAIQDAEATEP